MARGLGCNGSIRSNGRCELGRCAALQTLATACDHLQANISRAAGNARSLALAQAAHGAALAQAGNAVAGELEARSARVCSKSIRRAAKNRSGSMPISPTSSQRKASAPKLAHNGRSH
ncbi:MAG: hypothetical protein K8F35_14750 [Dokdonella sp.]|uniref:hypothetical protein n=1 Tax=Dokdonella sp. TaxID=2291710 RepID=UPI0025BAEF5B|nr:hypothetical protein [Dokdonella sp.]MBZ0224272.1 hypothetical protein [Dokdonella sp.]